MKLLLTSVDCLLDKKTGKLFNGITDQIDKYLSLSNKNRVVVISASGVGLDKIPKKYNPLKVSFKIRGKGDAFLEYVAKKTGFDTNEVIILGCKDMDMYTAAHIRAILLSANYAKSNNPSEKIYSKEYGIPLPTVVDVGLFFENFYHISDPWHLKIEVDDITTLYALTSANTIGYEGTPIASLRHRFKDCLKNDDDEHIVAFTSYFLMSARRITNELAGIDYWDIYPCSEANKINNDLLFFAKKASHSFGTEFQKERILIRTTNTTKRHSIGGDQRIANGCDGELTSIKINSYYNGKLRGKSVVIIDDFTRFGTSCETVRHLLKKAGVAKIVFIAMGKFGNDVNYHSYDYDLSGSIYSEIKAEKKSHSIVTGVKNIKSANEFLNSLRRLA